MCLPPFPGGSPRRFRAIALFGAARRAWMTMARREEARCFQKLTVTLLSRESRAVHGVQASSVNGAAFQVIMLRTRGILVIQPFFRGWQWFSRSLSPPQCDGGNFGRHPEAHWEAGPESCPGRDVELHAVNRVPAANEASVRAGHEGIHAEALPAVGVTGELQSRTGGSVFVGAAGTVVHDQPESFILLMI